MSYFLGFFWIFLRKASEKKGQQGAKERGSFFSPEKESWAMRIRENTQKKALLVKNLRLIAFLSCSVNNNLKKQKFQIKKGDSQDFNGIKQPRLVSALRASPRSLFER